MADSHSTGGSPLAALDELVHRLPQLSPCRSDIERAFKVIRNAYLAGNKVLVCGNGGSAADADHWAGELLKSFRKPRPLSAEDQKRLPPALAERLQEGLPMIPLTSFPALSTAFANDVEGELTFAQLVWSLARKGDVLVGISTSGNAHNVCAAVHAAQARSLPTIVLTGETGGALRPLADITIAAPARETFLVQELHLPIYHCLSLMLEEEFFPALPNSHSAAEKAALDQ